ncbi:MAG: hypothetical protein KDB27_05395 [Planctomycetales bacterium]|nr:hypothetical protein [Planctomycetales bacterium]
MRCFLNWCIRAGLMWASLCFSVATAAEQPLAFPGAEGWGRFATGGRGGDVYAVTNLNDDGPGSLRDAVSTGHRTVVFRVSGTIDLKSLLVVDQPNITIAGQSAPGDGICLRRFPLLIRRTHDIIVRYLRIRVGDEAGRALDGLEVRDSENIIVDHCSVSWSSDEAVNTWHGTKNITVQWCLISEPLHESVNYGPHGYGASLGGHRASYHHNLFAHCAGRNPSIAGGDHDHTELMDYRNNVVYNWLHRSCDGKPKSINVVNNYYKPGPATRPHVRRRVARIDDNMAKYGNFEPRWYIEGNVVEGEPALTDDNWNGGVDFQGNTNEAKNRQRTVFPFAPVTTHKAPDAYKLVLTDVGANRPARDTIDTRVLQEVKNGTASRGDNGIVDHQAESGDWPSLRSKAAPADNDGDGMPDAWEANHGLDSQDATDRNGHDIDAGYSNLESCLNEMAGSQAVASS